jgi:23S rRNA (guanosine2251-2'-O)-methyltransferase
VATCHNVAQALREIKEAGFWIYALDPAGGASVFERAWPERTALVVGNETAGIRPGVRKAADQTVSIPLAHGLDSLNVAVAAGIALFQVAAHYAHPRSGTSPADSSR